MYFIIKIVGYYENAFVNGLVPSTKYIINKKFVTIELCDHMTIVADK